MEKRKRLRLKKPFILIGKIVGVIFAVLLVVLLYFSYQIHELKELGYSSKASKNIILNWKKQEVMSVGKSKMLNAAFESNHYKDENFDSYAKIKYQEQENIIKNVNALISKGYSNSNISMILAHGDDADVSEFSKRDKIKYLEEFYSVSYAKLENYDRYVQYSDETGEDEETTVLYVNLDMDKGEYEDAITVSNFSVDMLINKHRGLDKDFVPSDLVEIDSEYAGNEDMKASKVALEAFSDMYEAAAKEGYGLVINSSYRTYQDQEEICSTYSRLYGDNYVKNYVAQPGFSEHQTGLAFDIGSTSSNVFAQSEEYQWMLEHAHEYGFILRFPKKYEEITGFRNEPWHYRYVGKDIAKYIHENNITFEEYFVMFLD